MGRFQREMAGVKLEPIELSVTANTARRGRHRQPEGADRRPGAEMTVNGTPSRSVPRLSGVYAEIASGKQFIDINGKTLGVEQAIVYAEGLVNAAPGRST